MNFKFEVVKKDRSSANPSQWTSKVVALSPWRGLAERYAALRDRVDPRPYVFFSVKERSS